MTSVLSTHSLKVFGSDEMATSTPIGLFPRPIDSMYDLAQRRSASTACGDCKCATTTAIQRLDDESSGHLSRLCRQID